MADRMKVLVLGDHPSDNWEGSSTIALQALLTEALAGTGEVEATLFIPRRRRPFVPFFFSPLRRRSVNNSVAITGGVVPFLFLLLRRRFDIVHAFVIRPYMEWILRIARVIGIPSVVTIHDTRFLEPGMDRRTVRNRRNVVRIARRLFVHSAWDHRRMNGTGESERAVMMRHGIDAAAAIDREPHGRSILFSGGLDDPRKGSAVVENAVRSLNVPHELILCGPNRTERHHASYRGVLSRDDHRSLLSSVRVCVVASDRESFSMTGLESLAAGTPLVITSECGLVHYLRHDHDALIVPPEDVRALSDAIRRLLTDDDLWRRLSRNGHRTSLGFSWKDVATEYRLQYDAVITALRTGTAA